MVNTKIIHVDEKSISLNVAIISFVMTLICGIIILLFGNTLLYESNIGTLFSSMSSFLTTIVLLAVISCFFINFVLNYFSAMIYNYLAKKIYPVEIKLSDDNKISKIEIKRSSIIIALTHTTILFILSMIIALCLQLLLSLVAGLSTDAEVVSLLSSGVFPIIFVIITVIYFFIRYVITLVFTFFVFNKLAKYNPIKVEIIEDHDVFEIRSINVESIIFSLGVSLATMSIIISIITFIFNLQLFNLILNIILNIILTVILTGICTIIYNESAKRVGGIKFKKAKINKDLPNYSFEFNDDLLESSDNNPDFKPEDEDYVVQENLNQKNSDGENLNVETMSDVLKDIDKNIEDFDDDEFDM